MNLANITDFAYKPPTEDISNIFSVEQNTNSDGSVDTFYNLNDGLVIEGIDEIPSDGVKVYKVISGDTLKSISYKIYGTINYWWLIAKLNRIDDAFIMLEAGTTLRVLDEEYMKYIVSMAKRGGE